MTTSSGAVAPPFSIYYTPQTAELLHRLGGTIVLSTYQAGKLIFLSAPDENRIIQLPRSFHKPMGIAECPERDHLAVACRDRVVTFANSPELAHHYPKSPSTYDALYVPRLTYHTGPLDIHDLSYGTAGELYAVNTLFSCIVRLNADYNFTPYWQPAFIDRLVSEDRCHLNGMAMEKGRPRYATAFSRTNTPQGWRPTVTESGVVFDLNAGTILAENLSMPHSPRLFNGELFVLLSATGEVIRINRSNGKRETVCRLDGFVRGMSRLGDYLFVGLNKLRKNASTFAKLPFADRAREAGVAIVHLPSGAVIGRIAYQSSVDEIYDVHLLAGKRRPNILNTLTEDHKSAVMIPETTYWGSLRGT